MRVLQEMESRLLKDEVPQHVRSTFLRPEHYKTENRFMPLLTSVCRAIKGQINTFLDGVTRKSDYTQIRPSIRNT